MLSSSVSVRPERHDHLGGEFGILAQIGIDSGVLTPASIQANRGAPDPLCRGAQVGSGHLPAP